jgi:hypothetical protein
MPSLLWGDAPSKNGTAERQQIQENLTGDPLTEGYRPTIPEWTFDGDMMPQFWLIRDIERMLIHPMVRNALNYFKSGISGAQFWGGANPLNPDDQMGLPVCAENPQVGEFVLEQCNRFWDRGVPKIQGGYDYGWIGSENLFVDDYGQLKWDDLHQFAPRDAHILTQDSKPVGVRIKNIREAKNERAVNGAVDLWLASRDVPAKGLWYAHDPRYHIYYGQSQLFGAWRPWRRLGWKDGAETVIDTGVYRFGFSGPIGRYPEEAVQTAQPMVPGTALDSQGRPRRWARDVMRQICEQIKAGAAVGLPSGKYPTEQGGDYKWGIEWPDHTIDVDGLINYAKYLQDQISYGVGVPPELLQAGETGSGYSGRQIPLESFLAAQQKIADAILRLFVAQVLAPLVRWNFGDVRWDVKVKSLLETKNKMKQVQQDKQTTNAGNAAAPPTPEQFAAQNKPGTQPADPFAPVAPAALFSLANATSMDRARALARQILRKAA